MVFICAHIYGFVILCCSSFISLSFLRTLLFPIFLPSLKCHLHLLNSDPKTDKSINSEQLFSGWQVRCIPVECGYGSKSLNAASPERPDVSINGAFTQVIQPGALTPPRIITLLVFGNNSGSRLCWLWLWTVFTDDGFQRRSRVMCTTESCQFVLQGSRSLIIGAEICLTLWAHWSKHAPNCVTIFKSL